MIVVHWNKSSGPEPILQYPPGEIFPSKELFLKIWAQHDLSKENFAVQYVPEDSENNPFQYISILQRFEGEVYFLLLIYNKSANTEMIIKEYIDVLGIISKNLIELINTNKITRAISEAFNTIKNYTKIGREENLLNFFHEKIKSIILKILQDGVISKPELSMILRKEYGFSTINIDFLLVSLIQEGLIVKKDVPGVNDCYFLIKDVSCLRVPPKDITSEMSSEVSKNYSNKLAKFFGSYDCSSELEVKSLINFLIDKEIFELIKLLREKSISVFETISMLNNREELFDELLEKNIIFEAQGQVYLFSDVRFVKFPPLYLLEKLVKRRENLEISNDQYLMHLKLLIDQIKDENSLKNYEII